MHIGIDLAWGPNGRTGVAAVDADGALVASGSIGTDAELDTWLDAHGPEQVVAVDAPITVPNATGRRDVERLIAAAWARFDAGPHPTNRGRPWMDPPRAAELVARRGWRTDPATPGPQPLCLEVYPHPGMVGLFRLGRIIPYKKGAYAERHAAFARLLSLLESLPALRLQDGAAWASVLRRFASATRPADLDRLEDEVDAVFCAHLAWRWAQQDGSLQVYGNARDGLIVAPPPPEWAPAPRTTSTAPLPGPQADLLPVGVGPWTGPVPEDPRLDPALLREGDRRNVVDRYRYWTVEAITADLDLRRHPFSVAVENWQHDLNIGSIVRTANAFLAEGVHIVGRRRWNRRGAMVTDRYQHVRHHDDVAALLAWARGEGRPVVAVDTAPGAVPVESVDLPERAVLLFGQEGPGLTREALDGADLVVEIPQWGSTRSINAAAAAAIVMHEWIRRWALPR